LDFVCRSRLTQFHRPCRNNCYSIEALSMFRAFLRRLSLPRNGLKPLCRNCCLPVRFMKPRFLETRAGADASDHP
jgi:hypothetical protein